VADPVADGFVKSLSRPGGNMTGFVTWPVQLAKQIELFREVVPGLRRPLVLIDPKDPVTRRELTQIRNTASALNLQLVERMVTTRADIERAFRTLKVKEVDGVIVPSPTLRTNFPSLVLRLASERKLPLASHRKKWVKRGGLFSYSADFITIGRAAAFTVDRILKGAKPADLPVERPRKFDLVINLKTAKRIGLTIPPEVLMRADKVIK
jgi:putative ABC transport system substrate-binding protein